MKKVLITGATGATGGNAIKKLLELKVPVRALVHKVDERSEKLSSQGVEIVRGDLSDFEAVSEALQGITAAYFVFPVKVPGILEATAFFAQAALEQGVGAIVNMSQISARRIAKSHAAQNHWIAERLLDRSGISVTHLRPTFFAEWITYLSESIREKNMFPLPFGGISGPLALEIVNQFAIATAFIGASGITDEAITVADYNEAQLMAAIIKRAQRVIFPMD